LPRPNEYSSDIKFFNEVSLTHLRPVIHDIIQVHRSVCEYMIQYQVVAVLSKWVLRGTRALFTKRRGGGEIDPI